MTRNQLNTYLGGIVTTLAETGEAPEGIMYVGLCARGATFDDFQTCMAVLVDSGLVKRSGHVATITDKGRALAQQIEAHLAKTAAGREARQ